MEQCLDLSRLHEKTKQNNPHTHTLRPTSSSAVKTVVVIENFIQKHQRCLGNLTANKVFLVFMMCLSCFVGVQYLMDTIQVLSWRSIQAEAQY